MIDLEQQKLIQLEMLSKAFSSFMRIRILKHMLMSNDVHTAYVSIRSLFDQEKNVEREQSTISHHLRILRHCKIIEQYHIGLFSFYRFPNQEVRKAVAQYIDALEALDKLL